MEELCQVMSSFSESMHELMSVKGLSVSELSRKTGISKTALSQWVNMQYLPSFNCLIKLTDFFNCSADYMFHLTSSSVLRRSPIPSTFFERFCTLARERDLSLSKVAKLCGFQDSTPSKWEKGELPKAEKLVVLSRFFNCSVEYLIGRAESR